MNIFLSKYINNFDKKGRISVPVNFRQVLAKEQFNGIIAYPSFKNKCIEACSLSRLEELGSLIQTLEPYSQERDALENIIFGQAVQMPFDSEGRIIVPKTLLEHAQVFDQACFIGKGQTFEIWQPDNLEKHLILARQVAQVTKLASSMYKV